MGCWREHLNPSVKFSAVQCSVVSGCDPRFHKATGNHDLCTSGATGMEKKIGRIQQSTTLDAEKFSRNFVPVGPVMEMNWYELRS
ncbi:hypothetical protein M0657_002403 [Pyricularia oryzae]|nr:hypothetical protein M9X92_006594 [Pyricularia oryzae]KAI7929145.1 hypothetical protein M0657_002403 [Pyricularia oryzae]QBZ54066.1 hypothetical protein PoMZ_09757 [Pyricularia oryzae]